MSRIVILMGSPRNNGNTELLVNAFVEGAKEQNQVEVVRVSEYKVNPCCGCNACYTNENHVCSQKDDMSEIYLKLTDADILVVASPVYFYGISAQLKAIIDRLHTPMRQQFAIKKTALLLVGAAKIPELFDAIKMQYELIDDFFHLENIGMVLANDVKEKGDVLESDAIRKAVELGQKIK